MRSDGGGEEGEEGDGGEVHEGGEGVLEGGVSTPKGTCDNLSVGIRISLTHFPQTSRLK